EGIWREEALLIAPDGKSGDLFGAAVAVSGDVLLVGAPGRTSLFTNAGEVYVFEREATGWVAAGKITRDPGSPTSSTGSGGAFGAQIVLRGQRATIAAPGEGRPANPGSNPGVGAVYVFERQGVGVWAQVALLRALSAKSDYHVGKGLAADDATIAASCVAPCSGITTFKVQDEQWAQSATVAPDDNFPVGRLGHSLAVDGNMLVVAGASSISLTQVYKPCSACLRSRTPKRSSANGPSRPTTICWWSLPEPRALRRTSQGRSWSTAARRAAPLS
ncbi:MAG: FG-GAP repeat protein, partial [Deltaproteobacteria bacterium]|nr:FG-GAP repeat protein [Deltaproteobacteria bacterium]